VRSCLAELLEADGCEVLAAADGREALAALAQFPAHVVVTDLMMPGMGGVELMRELRARGDERPVIVVTAREAAQALRAGARVVLSKPLDYGALIERTVAFSVPCSTIRPARSSGRQSLIWLDEIA